MRKITILVLMVGLLHGVVQAQRSTTSSNFKGGVRGGFTASQISGDNLTGFHKLGAYAGVYACFPLNDKGNLKIQAEIDFTMKGSRTYYPPKQNVSMMNKYVLNIGYLEVPVLLRWRFARLTIHGNSDFEFELGPMFGVNLYQRERDVYGIIQGRPQFRRFEFSAMAGILYMFNEHHGVSFRYSNSILHVRKPNWAVNRPVKMQYNSVMMISYFYQF